jgi:hypothetical protein
MLPSTKTVYGGFVFDENDAILFVNLAIIFEESKRPAMIN